MTEYADAKRVLEPLHRELMELNPSAVRSLEEGMEEACGSVSVCAGVGGVPSSKRSATH